MQKMGEDGGHRRGFDNQTLKDLPTFVHPAQRQVCTQILFVVLIRNKTERVSLPAQGPLRGWQGCMPPGWADHSVTRGEKDHRQGVHTQDSEAGHNTVSVSYLSRTAFQL